MIIDAGWIEYSRTGWASVGVLGVHIGYRERCLFSFEVQWCRRYSIGLFLDLFWLSFTLATPKLKEGAAQ